MAQDHGLCRKKKKVSNGPVHGPPLQARVAAANGTVLAACKLLKQTAGPDNKLLALNDDPGAHGMTDGKQSTMNRSKNWTGAKQTERGHMLMRAVGMAGKMQGKQEACRTGTAGRHSQRTLRTAQASKHTATDGRPCSKQTAADDVGLSPCR